MGLFSHLKEKGLCVYSIMIYSYIRIVYRTSAEPAR